MDNLSESEAILLDVGNLFGSLAVIVSLFIGYIAVCMIVDGCNKTLNKCKK